MVGGFHRVMLLFSGRASSVSCWVLVFSLKDALEEAGGRLLSSQCCSKAEKGPWGPQMDEAEAGELLSHCNGQAGM